MIWYRYSEWGNQENSVNGPRETRSNEMQSNSRKVAIGNNLINLIGQAFKVEGAFFYLIFA